MRVWLPFLFVALLLCGSREAAAGPTGQGCVRGGCHEDLTRRAVVHRPVEEGRCGSCHTQKQGGGEVPAFHAGVLSRPLAPARGAEACAGCHRPLPPPHAKIPDSPDALDSEPDACLGCHDPHGGETRADLRGSEGEVCQSCHERELASPRVPARPLPRAEEADREQPEVRRHGPFAAGRCSPCHRAHAAAPEGRLIGALPAGSYAPYHRDTYSACLGPCHGADGIEEARTRSATAFRNGDDNLHFRHVVQPRKGRSCRLCHAPHHATNAALIRSSMPYGKVRLTLAFTATDLGGRCVTSCHIPVAYDREEAVPSRMRIAEPTAITEGP